MIARYRDMDGAPQSLCEHSREVAEGMKEILAPYGLGETGFLIGLLHDMGKATEAFQQYLEWMREHPGQSRVHAPHAISGAIYAHEHWFHEQAGLARRVTAQMAGLCIMAHHAGLPDCLDPAGNSLFLSNLQWDRDQIGYEEAVDNFFPEVAKVSELEEAFQNACREIEAILAKCSDNRAFFIGLLTRLVLSALVDADRWSAACFDAGQKCSLREDRPDWASRCVCLEKHLCQDRFQRKGRLGDIRRAIGAACLDAAAGTGGVFRLTVPTGGGKTLASLRFALNHARVHDMRRIFYIIPFNTILEQNAKDIREALNQDEKILEHHGNVILEDDQDGAETEKAYVRLTERWDAEIILTSIVQFMNALYRKENSNARRMYRLGKAVLVFDEIQALPPACTELFQRAIRFLVDICGCTVVLCTATQPSLKLEARELVPQVSELFHDLRRVNYVDETDHRMSYDEAAWRLAGLLRTRGSVLVVVNTKAAALSLYQSVKAENAADCCLYLTTNLCPEHRRRILEEASARLDRNETVFLVSTALIEAGINISFPTVVRSNAALSSIIQAAGRCNRDGAPEKGALGLVLIWNLYEENLSRLPDIKVGREMSAQLLDWLRGKPLKIDEPEVIRRYFEKAGVVYKEQQCFPLKEYHTDLVEMLSMNKTGLQAARSLRDNPCSRMVMYQSFRTAGGAFHVIDQETRLAVVPYGKGKNYILDLGAVSSLEERRRLLRAAQRYSVSLYQNSFSQLLREHIIEPIGDTGAYALSEEHYDRETGLSKQAGEMAYWGF